MKKTIVSIAAVLVMVLAAVSALAADVKIDESHFPDSVFRAYVKTFDSDSDGALSDAERDKVTVIDVENKAIKDLTGLGQFPALKELHANFVPVTELDVSGNAALEVLECHGCALSALIVSHNPALRILKCGRNQIGKLDVRKNPKLEELYCTFNKLIGLNVTKNPKLKVLDCSENGIASLNVSANPKLVTLECADNRLEKLDLSKNTALQSLICEDNELESLDLSKNTELLALNADENELKSLDVSMCPKLFELGCEENGLTSLTLGAGIQGLYIKENKLTSLDVSKCAVLEVLDMESNSVKSLDLSHNTKLRQLNCSSNKLTALDVSNNTALVELDCSFNQIRSLYLAKNTRLKELYCGKNCLTALDLTKNKKLTNKYLDGNELKVTAEAGWVFYSSLPGFDKTKVSNVSGAKKTVSGFRVTESGKVTYDYEAAKGITVTFTLNVKYVKGKISSVTIPQSKYPYTGKAVKPETVVKAKVAGKTLTLTKGEDYKVAYKNNKNAGTATITVTGIGHYKGTLTKTFKITRVKISGVTLSKTSYTYTGKAHRPKVTGTAVVDGKKVTLEKGVDYTVTYENNVQKGKAKVIVTGIGNFTGTLPKRFTIK